MSTILIALPGEQAQATLAELLNLKESEEIVAKWHARMQVIEDSERSAQDEEASIRFR